MGIPTTFNDNNTPDLEASVLNGMQRQLMEVVTTASPTSDYQLAMVDAGSCIEASHASTQIAIIVPGNNIVPFPIGTVIEIVRMGDGEVVIFPDFGNGVTIKSRGGLLYIASKYSSVSLRKRATNDWHLVGDLYSGP